MNKRLSKKNVSPIRFRQYKTTTMENPPNVVICHVKKNNFNDLKISQVIIFSLLWEVL